MFDIHDVLAPSLRRSHTFRPRTHGQSLAYRSLQLFGFHRFGNVASVACEDLLAYPVACTANDNGRFRKKPLSSGAIQHLQPRLVGQSDIRHEKVVALVSKTLQTFACTPCERDRMLARRMK